MIVAKILDKSQYTTNHFGQPFLCVMNGVEILRMMFKKMAKELNVELG